MQKYILILFVLSYSYIDGQKFPVKRTFEYGYFFIISGKDLKNKGDYFEDREGRYNPYIGTWYYKENDLVFILKLQKIRTLFTNYENKRYYWLYMDRLQSTFKIIKNNVVLIDNLNEPTIETFFQKEKKETDKYGGFMASSDGQSLTGQLRSTSLGYFNGSIYLMETNDKIRFELNYISGFCERSVAKNEPLCLLPKDIELSRYTSELVCIYHFEKSL